MRGLVSPDPQDGYLIEYGEDCPVCQNPLYCNEIGQQVHCSTCDTDDGEPANYPGDEPW